MASATRSHDIQSHCQGAASAALRRTWTPRSESRQALQLRPVANPHSRRDSRWHLRREHHNGVDFEARTAAVVATQATLMQHRQRSAREGTHHSKPLLFSRVQKASSHSTPMVFHPTTPVTASIDGQDLDSEGSRLVVARRTRVVAHQRPGIGLWVAAYSSRLRLGGRSLARCGAGTWQH